MWTAFYEAVLFLASNMSLEKLKVRSTGALKLLILN